MASGGLWADYPRGFLDAQIERQIASGIPAQAAHRYAHAVQFGGCTTAEALGIIRDRDCAPNGTMIELWDASDLPSDRWFRNAWKRSANGGPISIDLHKAKPIQFARARRAIDAENARRKQHLDCFDRTLDVDWGAFSRRVRAARCVEDLRRIWPEATR